MFRSVLLINSSTVSAVFILYFISKLRFLKNLFCILEHCILWTQQDKLDGNTENISDITLSNFLFEHALVFHLYGTATFKNWFVYGWLFVIYLHESSIEATTPVEKNSSYSMTHHVHFFGTKFDLESNFYGYGFYIKTINCVRGIIIRNCTFLNSDDDYVSEIIFSLEGKSLSDRTIANNILIQDCFFRGFFIEFDVIPRIGGFSFLFVEINDIVFYDSCAFKIISGGLAAFVVQNCSFPGIRGADPGLFISWMSYMSLYLTVHFKHTIYTAGKGCAISVRGVGISVHHTFIAFLNKFFKSIYTEPTLIIRRITIYWKHSRAIRGLSELCGCSP